MPKIEHHGIGTVTADAGYAHVKVYAGLRCRGIDSVIPAKKEPIRIRVPVRRFQYDARHDTLKCPRDKTLRRQRGVKHGRFFCSRARSCALCAQGRLSV